MNDYARSIAQRTGIIEARDLAPGDIILRREPFGTERVPHAVVSVEWRQTEPYVRYACGCAMLHSPRMPMRLVALGGAR